MRCLFSDQGLTRHTLHDHVVESKQDRSLVYSSDLYPIGSIQYLARYTYPMHYLSDTKRIDSYAVKSARELLVHAVRTSFAPFHHWSHERSMVVTARRWIIHMFSTFEVTALI